MSSQIGPTPDWLLERIALEELPPRQLEAARAQLMSEPDGLARLEDLHASDREILDRYTATEMVKALHRRSASAAELSEQRKPWWPLVIAAPALAAAAIALVALPSEVVVPPEAPSGTELESSRLKGLQPRLLVYRQQGSGVVLLEQDDQARPRDRLQLAYVAGGRGHGALVSIDGRGAVTLHLPSAGDGSASLEASGAHMLPFSIELDDAPEFERFFLVVAEQAFELQQVLRPARELATSPQRARTERLQLPPGLEQISFVLRKASP